MSAESKAKSQRILLELDPDTADIAATMAMSEGVSITRFSERIVLAELRRRLKEGDVESFTKSIKQRCLRCSEGLDLGREAN